MPDEIRPFKSPNTIHNDEGVISPKTKRWLVLGGVGALVLLVILLSMTSKPVPIAQPIAKHAPVTPDDLKRKADQDRELEYERSQAKWRAKHPPLESREPELREPQGGQAPIRNEVQDDKQKREQESAHSDSLIPRPANRETSKANVPQQPKTPDATKPDEEPAKQTNLYPIDESLPKRRIRQGTIIPAALVNKLEGEYAGPLEVQITKDIYADGTREIIIPQGSTMIGNVAKVSSQNQERLATTFDRLFIGSGDDAYSVSLDKSIGLDQEGATALHDQVNNHYLQIFGASLAIGAIGGLAQIGNSYQGYGYDPSVQFRNGITQSMAESANRILDRFLQRLPTITIRPGTRVDVWLREDLSIPVPKSESDEISEAR
jgi:type IV secretory pathway VirB10-like protein